ncbi:MAG TPA: hypothetical protein VK689_21215 [Armatimonadota bacterium]|nr:hypothetical protein [Armatimonadota bacterium]
MYRDTVAPQTTPAPRIGEWLSEAFSLFGQQWQVWVGQGLVCLFIGYAPSILGMIAYMAIVFGSGFATSSSDPSKSPAAFTTMLAAMGAMYGGLFLSIFTYVYTWSGMTRTAAKQLRGEPIRTRDIFSAGDVYLPALGVTLVVGVLYVFGAILCLVPGLLVMGLFTFSHSLVVEKRMGVSEALRTSWETTKPHMWMYLLWHLLVMIISSVGTYACYVGVAVTLPIAVLALVIAYRDVIGIPGALPPLNARQSPAAPQPMGNYGPAGPPVAAAPCPSCGRGVAAGAVVCPSCSAALPQGVQPAAGAYPPPAWGAPKPGTPPSAAGFTPPPSAPPPPNPTPEPPRPDEPR